MSWFRGFQPPPPSYRTSGSNKTQLIIGLDFGTAYSSVAYAYSDRPEHIHIIRDWPGSNGKEHDECPTLIEYSSTFEFKWGLEVDRSSSSCIEGIKQLLDPDQPQPDGYIPDTDLSAELRRLGKTPLEVATDYLRAVCQHAIRIIKSAGRPEYVNSMSKQFVLSVPAVWSDKAKNLILNAARTAGIDPVKLIKEPEASALCTVHSMGTNRGLNAGDAFVLCDVGGGTVDLISYEITGLRPFELVELTTCTGSLAGSLLINRHFESWIRRSLGNQEYSELRKKAGYRTAMRQFDEKLKPAFTSRDQRPIGLSFQGAGLRDNPQIGLRRGTINVTGSVLGDMFDPVVQQIEELVRQQVRMAQQKRRTRWNDHSLTVKAILLVGGFGCSKYLSNTLARSFPTMRVIQPENACSTIVRGAVMSQIPSEAQVVTNIAPKHYGICAFSKYVEERDRGHQTTWEPYYEQLDVETMTWYIKKGEDLSRAHTIKFPFFRTFDPYPSEQDLQITEILRECSLNTAPLHFRNSNITTNCTLRCDLSTVPESYFKRKSAFSRRDGRKLEWWELHYEIVVTIQSGPMRFSVQCRGREYGQVRAEY